MRNVSRQSGRTFMAETNVSAKDRERYARARARGEARAQDPSAVVEEGYDPDRELIDLTFGGGGSMAIPRNAVPGLQRAPRHALSRSSCLRRATRCRGLRW